MKRLLFYFLFLCSTFCCIEAVKNVHRFETDNPTFVHESSDRYVWPEDSLVLAQLDDWQDRKLGVMFHWGVYSIPGISESWPLCSEDRFTKRRQRANPQCKNYGEFKEWYWGLANQFNPANFNPGKWADFFSKNGFKYLIFTTKHHDGFCMFDTRQTDYKVTNTPYQDSLYANVAYHVFDAFRKKGFMIGAYFSKPDWHNENFWDPMLSSPTRYPNYDVKKYPEKWNNFQEYTAAQIDELMSDYGRIDILWLDGGWVKLPKLDLKIDAIIDSARIKQPGLIAVDRTVPGRNENYQTPEQTIPDVQQPFPWETCVTFSNSWGWNPRPKYKTSRWVINTLAEVVAKGGCMALNVGPDKNGNIDEIVYERLGVVGDWLNRNGQAVYSTRITPNYVSGNVWFTASKDGRTLYAISMLKDGESNPAVIEWQGNIPQGKMIMLNTGQRVKYSVAGNKVSVYIPDGVPDEPLAFRFVKSEK